MDSELLNQADKVKTCNAKAREKWPLVALRGYIKEVNERNTAEELDAKAVRGISTNKDFMRVRAYLWVEDVPEDPPKLCRTRSCHNSVS